MTIRPATPGDAQAIWRILEPHVRAGEVFALPCDEGEAAAVADWIGGDHRAYVCEEAGRIVGTFYLRPNRRGGGGHVANAGYAVSVDAGGRGIARRMAEASLDLARAADFRAMQFNFVVSVNVRAVALWRSLGFAIVGRLPRAFRHPTLGEVDALVMHRSL